MLTAGVAELADAQDLGSCVYGRGSSSLPTRTVPRARISKSGAKIYRAWKTIAKPSSKDKVAAGKNYRFQVAAIVEGGPGPLSRIRFVGR